MNDYPPPAAPAPYQPVPRWAAGALRELTVAVGPARTAVLQAVRALDFATTAEHYTSIEAERGSRLRGLSLTRSRVPVSLRVGITASDGGTSLDIRLEDRWTSAARTPAAVAVYADVFTEVLTRIDEQLARTDPKAAAGFDGWWRVLPEALVATGAQGAAGAARFDAALQRRSARLLDGPRHAPAAAVSGAGVQGLSFSAPDAVAHVSAEVADGMLTAGQLVASAPGTMPPPLVEQVTAMVVELEQRIADARRGGWQGHVPLEVGQADKPVLTFLFQQAALREKLPVRQLMTCTTCKLEKVVNPAFLKERERNRRVRVLQTSVGAVLGAHQVSPFILFGRLAQLKKTDPDFVCVRCQGTDADEKPITFCSRCGDRRDESALTVCPKCKLDLRSLLGDKREVWTAIEATPEAPAAIAVPAAGADEPVAPSVSEDVAEAVSVDEASADGWGAATVTTSSSVDADGAPSGPWGPPVGPTFPATWAPPAGAWAAPVAGAMPPGWYADPWGRHDVRFWDGVEWTVHVGTGGVTTVDAPSVP